MMSTYTTTRMTFGSSLKGMLTRHPVTAFYVLAYAGTWLFLLPLLLATNGLGLIPVTLPVVPFLLPALYAGPTGAALIMTALLGGRPAVRHLLRRYVQWRVPTRWYLFALFVPPILVTAGASLFQGAAALQPITSEGPAFVPLFLLSMVVLGMAGGPLAENVGWRGFALPRLQARYGALAGSMVLGVLWALWHLPLFFIEGANTWTGNTLEYIVLAMALAIIFTWMYNNTGGSLLLAILLHAAIDTSTRLLLPYIPGLSRAAGNHALTIAFSVFALILIVVTRGGLAYQPAQTARTNDADLAH